MELKSYGVDKSLYKNHPSFLNWLRYSIYNALNIFVNIKKINYSFKLSLVKFNNSLECFAYLH